MTIHHENSKKSVWEKTVKVEVNSAYWNGQPKIKKGKKLPSKKPIVVELFCGCGGTSLGFEMAGFHIALGGDIHAPSIETFQHNHPKSSTILGDVKKIKPTQIQEILGNRKVDVLIAGVPCQGFSLNNRKRHQQDDRNFLYQEFIRFVKKLVSHISGEYHLILDNGTELKVSRSHRDRVKEMIKT